MSNSEDIEALCSSKDASFDLTTNQIDINTLLSIYRPTNNMKFLLESKSLTQDSYSETLLPFLIPGLILIFLIIVRILWCIFLVLRKKKLLCLKFFKYIDKISMTYSTKRKYIFGGIIISFLALVPVIAGVIFSIQVLKNTDHAYCGYYTLLQTVANQNNRYNWIGFSPGHSTLSTINSMLPTTYNNITNKRSALKTTYTSLQTAENNLFSKLDSVYHTHSPRTVDLPYFGIAEAPYNPLFLQSLGPVGNENTELGAFSKKVQEVAGNVMSSNTAIIDETNNLINDYSTYYQNMLDLDQAFLSLKTWYESFNSNNQSPLKFSDARSKFRAFAIVFISCLSFFCLANIIIMTTMSSLYKGKLQKESKAYSLLTTLSIIISIIYSILITFLYPLAVTSVETCDLVTLSMSNKEFFTDNFLYFEGMTTDSLEFLSYCIHEESDLATKYDVSDFLSTYESFSLNTDSLIKTANIPLDTVTTLENQASRHYNFDIFVDRYDSSRTVKVEDKLEELNTLTNYQSRNNIQVSLARCSVLADTWKIYSNHCPRTLSLVEVGYEGSSNFGKPSCLGIAEVSPTGIIERHSNYKFIECTTMMGVGVKSGKVNDNIHAYLNTFVQHVQTTQNVFGDLLADLGDLNTNEVSDFKGEINSIQIPVKSLKQSTIEMSKLLTPEGGTSLKRKLDCSGIKEEAEQLRYKLCNKLTYSMQALAIIIPIAFAMVAIQTFVYFKLFIATI